MILNNKLLRVVSGWKWILGPYFTRYIFSSILNANKSYDDGQRETEMFLWVFQTLEMMNCSYEATN